MPLNDYKCKECNTVFEVFLHWFADSQMCPQCGGLAKRLMPRVQIKSGGEKQDALIDRAKINAWIEREKPNSKEVKDMKNDPAAKEAKKYCDDLGITL